MSGPREAGAPARIVAYAEGIKGRYADTFLLRQVAALDANLVVGAWEAPTPNPGTALGRPRFPFDRVDARLGGAMQRTRLWTSYSMVRPLWLRRQLADADLVYSFFLWNAWTVVDALQLSRRRMGPPLVVHAGGSDVTMLRARAPEDRWRELRVLRAATRVLCGSEFLRRCLLELGLPAHKLEVHYIGIDVGGAPEARGGSRDAVTFLAVSRLVPVKGVAFTLHAFADAFPGGHGARLMVLGDGPQREELEALARSLGIADAVDFRGHVAPADVARAMAEADVLVQHNVVPPDKSEEALGGSLLEAGAAGLPVIATRTGGVPEAVLDGVSGHLVEPGDVRAMAEHMRRLAAAPDERRALGEAGRAHVVRSHDAERQDRRLRELLHDLAVKERARRR